MSADEEDRRSPKARSAARDAYGHAEVRAKVQAPTGFSTKGVSTEEKAAKAVPQLITALGTLLKQHPYLPEKKRLYVQYGCRGDWPVLQPPEWDPLLSEVFGRERSVPLAGSDPASEEEATAARMAAGAAAVAAKPAEQT